MCTLTSLHFFPLDRIVQWKLLWLTDFQATSLAFAPTLPSNVPIATSLATCTARVSWSWSYRGWVSLYLWSKPLPISHWALRHYWRRLPYSIWWTTLCQRYLKSFNWISLHRGLPVMTWKQVTSSLLQCFSQMIFHALWISLFWNIFAATRLRWVRNVHRLFISWC